MIISGLKVIDNRPWIWDVPCMLDSKYKGSINDKIGLSAWICPHCNAHLSKNFICLNACHLTAAGLRRFERAMSEARAMAQEKHFRKEQITKASDTQIPNKPSKLFY